MNTNINIKELWLGCLSGILGKSHPLSSPEKERRFVTLRNAALAVALLLYAQGCVTSPPTLSEVASSLPKEFKNIVVSEGLGVGTALFGQLFKSNGTLVVSREHIEHSTRNKTITIPVANVRSVTQRIVNDKAPRPWVVVEYEQDGELKRIAFQEHGLGSRYFAIDHIYQTILFACKPDASGGTAQR